MISKKMLAVFGVAALAAGLTVAPAFAKKGCAKLCKDNLSRCMDAAKTANDCTGLTGSAKKDCKKALKAAKAACKTTNKENVKACKAADASDNSTTCDSPSAAFLD